MEQNLTLASLGDVGLDPGVQLKKSMKGVNGDIAAKIVQQKVNEQLSFDINFDLF